LLLLLLLMMMMMMMMKQSINSSSRNMLLMCVQKLHARLTSSSLSPVRARISATESFQLILSIVHNAFFWLFVYFCLMLSFF